MVKDKASNTANGFRPREWPPRRSFRCVNDDELAHAIASYMYDDLLRTTFSDLGTSRESCSLRFRTSLPENFGAGSQLRLIKRLLRFVWRWRRRYWDIPKRAPVLSSQWMVQKPGATHQAIERFAWTGINDVHKMERMIGSSDPKQLTDSQRSSLHSDSV